MRFSFVTSQVPLAVELLVALLALQQQLPAARPVFKGVRQFGVTGQMLVGGEASLAEGALEELGPVDPDRVPPHLGQRLELLVAGGAAADEQLLVAGHHVLLQVILLGEAFLAGLARVALVLVPEPDVKVERLLRG